MNYTTTTTIMGALLLGVSFAAAETHLITYNPSPAAFTPDTVTVEPGDTVIFEINGSAPPGHAKNISSGTECQYDGFFFDVNIGYGNPNYIFEFEVPFHAGSVPFFCARSWTNPSCAAQGVIYIDTGGDTLHVPADHATIASAIHAAADGDLIQIAPGTYYEHDLQLTAKAITIRGELGADGMPAVTIDAQQQGRVLTCTGPAADRPLIEAIAFTGGLSADHGGALYCDEEWLLLRSCTFSGNEAAGRGGAVHARSNPSPPMGGPGPSFAACTITGNTAASDGGGVSCAANRAQLRHCIVGQNTAVSGTGGGLFHAGGKFGGGTAFHTSVVCGNSPDQVLGVLPSESSCVSFWCQIDDDGMPFGCQYDEDGILHVPSEYPTIQDAFSGAGDGQTIQLAAGTYQITEPDELDFRGVSVSIIGEPSADGTPAVIIDGQMSGATGIVVGYAEGLIEIRNLHLTGLANPLSILYCNAVVENCTIESNAVYYGSLQLSDCNATVERCTLINNAGTYGGGVAIIDVGNHSATQVSLIDCLIEGNYGGYQGYAIGGVLMAHGHTTIDGCTIKDNNGGGIGGVSVFPKATATIVDSTVCGNVGYKGDTTQISGDYTDNGGNIVAEECPAECAPDINGDGIVNVSDLLQLIGAWGPCSGCDEDIDDSGEVNVSDLLTVIAAWGDCE